MVVKRGGGCGERGEPRHLRITSGQSACPRDPAHYRAVVWQLQEKETWWGWGGRGGRRRWRLWVSETDNHWSLTNVYPLNLCGSAWFTPQTWHFTSTLSRMLTSGRHRNAHLVLIISANSIMEICSDLFMADTVGFWFFFYHYQEQNIKV